MKYDDILKTFGGLISAIITFWLASATVLSPPEGEGAARFFAVAAVFGAVLGGAFSLVTKDQRLPRNLVLILAGALGFLGVITFFFYESAYDARTAKVTITKGEHQVQVDRIIADRLSEFGVRITKEQVFSPCKDTGGVNEQTRSVSYDCAAAIMKEMPVQRDYIFDGDSLRESFSVLNTLYRVMAAFFMLSLFLLVDEFAFGNGRRRAGRSTSGKPTGKSSTA